MDELMLSEEKHRTRDHIDRVRHYLGKFADELGRRGKVHDQSKLEEPEASAFAQANDKGFLSSVTYGSDEYKTRIKELLGPALDHHYANNSHHPEHFETWRCPVCDGEYLSRDEFPDDGRCLTCRDVVDGLDSDDRVELERVIGSGVSGMSLFDLVECFCDWAAACERHSDGDLARSVEINGSRFGMDVSARILSVVREQMELAQLNCDSKAGCVSARDALRRIGEIAEEGDQLLRIMENSVEKFQRWI